MKLKKIVNIGNSYFVEGGDTRYMFFLEELLRSKNITVIPFAPQSKNNLDTPYSSYFPESINIKTATYGDFIKYLYNKNARTSIEKLLKKEKDVQLAHLHIYYGRLTTSILKPLVNAGIPIIQTLHEYKLSCPVYSMISNEKICNKCQGSKFWNCTINKCNRGSISRSVSSTIEAYFSKSMGNSDHISHFVPSSNFLRDKMLEIGIDERKLTTVHNFVDTNNFNQDFSIGEHFIFIGRIEKLKGIFTLLRAFENLPEYKLLIVGVGEAEAEAKSYISSKNIKNIKMLGFKQNDELFKLVENSIASIIPSEWFENCPLSAFESFAIGKPIIGSNIGGIPELISHGKDGFLFEPGNAEELQHYVKLIANKKNIAPQMGISGHNKVKRIFNPENHFLKLNKIYQSVMP